VVRDNWVYNHANKGYEVAGAWVTIRDNHNECDYLESGSSRAYGIGGWTLTLDGRVAGFSAVDATSLSAGGEVCIEANERTSESR
jgi:hypothetical protein